VQPTGGRIVAPGQRGRRRCGVRSAAHGRGRWCHRGRSRSRAGFRRSEAGRRHYLVWLAVKLWRRAGHLRPAETLSSGLPSGETEAGWRDIGLGAVLTASNPQALLFYVAVLPAVLGSERIPAAQYLLLCLVLSAVMAAIATGYIGLATRPRTALSCSRRRVADRAGALLLGLIGAVVAAR
jgi:threonine/homoserine/homoserine lactone efflux protein